MPVVSATAGLTQTADQLAGVGRVRRPLLLIEDAGFVIGARHQEHFPLHLWQLGNHSGGEAFPA